MKICENPDILEIIKMIKDITVILTIIASVALVIFSMIDLLKVVTSPDADNKKGFNSIIKRFMAAALVFLVPIIVGFVLNITGETLEYGSCMDNANSTYINQSYVVKAEYILATAEKNKNYDNFYKAQKYINKIKDEEINKKMNERLKTVKKYLDDIKKAQNEPLYDINNDILYNNTGGYITTGNNTNCEGMTMLNIEPDPSMAINFWAKKGILTASNFVYPKDKQGKSLGAWPKNFNGKSTISIGKRYTSNLIFPMTPSNGIYRFGYEHRGIDIAAPVGEPVYAPASGTLTYSAWGGTKNKRCSETAYTVQIAPDEVINYGGISSNDIFLTHLSGIVRNCNSSKNCNYKVKAGELIGFVGTASSGSTPGFAPHLHMSIYKQGNYANGLMTTKIESLYGLKSGQAKKAGA
ncbi:MAG: peptidoglycan DD-metalloendopeptidase family protein [Bacilli bacterium]